MSTEKEPRLSYEPLDFNVENREIEKEVMELAAEYEKQFHTFAEAKDNYLAGFSLLMSMDILGNNPVYKSIRKGLVGLLERRRQFTTDHISSEANWVRSALQYEILNHYMENDEFENHIANRAGRTYQKRASRFPWGYEDENGETLDPSEVDPLQVAGDWVSGLDFIMRDKSPDAIGVGVLERNVQTTVVQRYVPLKIWIADWYHSGNIRPPRILDFGCSVNHGLEALTQEGLFYDKSAKSPFFQQMEARYVFPAGAAGADQSVFSEKLNQVLFSCGRPVGASIGVDIWPNDQATKNWAKACRRQSELLDIEQMKIYEGLDKANSSQFLQANLLEEDPPQLQSQQFDVIYAATVLHQLSAPEVTKFFEVMPKYLARGGKIIVVDFLETDQSAPHGIHFRKSLYEENQAFPYRAIIIDPKNGSSPEDFMLFANGRCRSAAVIQNSCIKLF